MAQQNNSFNIDSLVKQAQSSLEEARAFDQTADSPFTRETRYQESIAYSLLAICHSLQSNMQSQQLISPGSRT